MKLMLCSGVAKIYSQMKEGEWGQSAMDICAFCYIIHLCSVMELHIFVVD